MVSYLVNTIQTAICNNGSKALLKKGTLFHKVPLCPERYEYILGGSAKFGSLLVFMSAVKVIDSLCIHLFQ